jgi:hypothetical protein
VKIDTVTEHVNHFEKITDQQTLTDMYNFFVGQNIRKEISKLESLTENIVNSNYEENDRVYFGRLASLKSNLDFLLNLPRIHSDDPRDEKPLIIELVTKISEDINYLSEDK